MLRAVESSSRLTYQKVNEILDAQKDILEVVESDTDIRRPDRLVEAIFFQPYTKVSHLVERGIYAENTARKYLNKLADLQILERKEIQGHHYYLNLELEHILSW